jgi:hypothetical protein
MGVSRAVVLKKRKKPLTMPCQLHSFGSVRLHDTSIEQDRQCTCNVRLRRVRATIVAE